MSGRAVEHAIAAVRAGRPVRIEDSVFIPVETTTAALLATADPDGKATLLLSGARATALSLANDINAADVSLPVAIARTDWLDAETALALADPGRDVERGLSGPLKALPLDRPAEAQAALTLARLAGLLPALWMVSGAEATARVSVEEITSAPSGVMIVARARLPLEALPLTQIVVFRAVGDGQEHVALVIGAFEGQPPLVRLHSECLTGDVFGSLKCDCGPQLHEALRLIGAAGGGILLYLRQEGRGVGIANKIRAYALQDRGLDTVDANRRLGFADDERGYAPAAAMLCALGADRVRLLTNNPGKVAGLEAAGIAVVERVAHHMPVNPHNADYLATKRKKSGHLA
ncbi:MAG: GTP cyclohydrolase II [Sphingomicrobium sp.]